MKDSKKLIDNSNKRQQKQSLQKDLKDSTKSAKKSGRRRSDAWKNFERNIALEARKVGFLKAFRVCRGDDIGVSAVDVIIPEIPFVKVDTKYRVDGWSHHSIFSESEKKYCQSKGDFMILPTKAGGDHYSLSTIRTSVLMELLSYKYINKQRPPEAMGCPKCSGIAKPAKIGLHLSECTCISCHLTFFVRTEDVPPGAENPSLFEPYSATIDQQDHPLEILVSDEDCQPQVKQKRRAGRPKKEV